MSELRIKLLDLAIQAGATIENAQRVATDWEQWATEDDPLRLDVPNIPDESYEDQLARVFTEEQVGIDWSRPQLVHLIDEPDFIVRTTGLVGFDEFQGYSDADGDIPDWYKKKRFEYHGEIEEPKNPGKKENEIRAQEGDSIPKDVYDEANSYAKIFDNNYHRHSGFLAGAMWASKNPIKKEREIDWSRPQLVINPASKRVIKTTGNHDDDTFSGSVVEAGSGMFGVGASGDNWSKSVYEYHGEIPQESKTTGLNFLEAVKLCKSGRRIGRKAWCPDYWLVSDQVDGDYVENMDGDRVSLNVRDALATDWQIVKS